MIESVTSAADASSSGTFAVRTALCAPKTIIPRERSVRVVEVLIAVEIPSEAGDAFRNEQA
jgi:hypothetical protein